MGLEEERERVARERAQKLREDTSVGQDGLSVCNAPWMKEIEAASSGSFVLSDGREVVPSGVLKAVKDFQNTTLPTLEAAAGDFTFNFEDDLGNRRILERDAQGLPSCIALQEKHETEGSGGVEWASRNHASDSTQGTQEDTAPTYDVFLTFPTGGEEMWSPPRVSTAPHVAPSHGSDSPAPVSGDTAHRPFSSAVAPSRRTASSSVALPAHSSSSQIRPSGGGRAPRPPPGHKAAREARGPSGGVAGEGLIRSGIIISKNSAQGIMKGLKVQRSTSAPLARPTPSSSPAPLPQVARVVRPMVLAVCTGCRRCFEWDASLGMRQAVCQSCGYEHVDISSLYRFPAPEEEKSDDNENNGEEAPVVFKVGEGRSSRKDAVASSSPPPAPKAATVSEGCGGDNIINWDDEDEGELTTQDVGTTVEANLSIPLATLSRAVKGTYFTYLWELTESSQM